MGMDLVGNVVLASNTSETGINIKGNATSVVTNKLVDTGWNFTIAGVSVGDKVVNIDTGKTATVDAIDSPSTLSLSSDIMASVGDSYFITDSTKVVVVYVELMDEIYNKMLRLIKKPQGSANWSLGPKDTKIVDMLRVEYRYSVRGYIDSASKSDIQALFIKGGIFLMYWDGGRFNVNMDKLTVSKSSKFGEQDERRVIFTVVEGINL